MRVYEFAQENFNIRKLRNLNLPASGLYLLAQAKCPVGARKEIVERAEAGESVGIAEIKSVVAAHKAIAKPPSPKPVKSSPAPAKKISKWDSRSNLMQAWEDTGPDDRVNFIEAIGMNELVRAIPPAWRKTLAKRLADWEAAPVSPKRKAKAAASKPEDMTADPKKDGIPEFLQVQNRTMPLNGKVALPAINGGSV